MPFTAEKASFLDGGMEKFGMPVMNWTECDISFTCAYEILKKRFINNVLS